MWQNEILRLFYETILVILLLCQKKNQWYKDFDFKMSCIFNTNTIFLWGPKSKQGTNLLTPDYQNDHNGLSVSEPFVS